MTLSCIPKHPKTCSSQFHLDAVVTQYLCCSACHCLYPHEPGETLNGLTPDRSLSTPHSTVNSSHCTYQDTKDKGPCGAPLWKEMRVGGDHVVPIPIWKYYHQDFKSWLGRLLARKGIEEHIEPRLNPTTRTIDDICMSDVILNLKDDSGNKFYPGPKDEGRLIFSLSVDSFDPLGNKTARQSISSTGIWLVLLNLPWHLRYRPENLYLAGVIPDKPATHQINHYLELIIKAFLEFWHPGIFFSRTYKYRLGRLFKAMIIPVVCDMLAVRQVIGASSPTSHYICTLCDLDIHDIGVLHHTDWPKKSLSDIIEFATLWHNAETEHDRDSIFHAFGWRWSPLFNLPYFDPTLFTVVDSMHTLDLGLLQHHCRELFGIDVKHVGGDGSPPPQTTWSTTKVLSDHDDIPKLKRCHNLIRENKTPPELLYEILNFDRHELYTICVYYDIQEEGTRNIVGTKWWLAKQINNWVYFISLFSCIFLTYPILNTYN